MDNKGNDGKPLHLGHRQRIKERYTERGFIALDDKDILELVLTYAIPRRDVYTIARDLIHEYGTVDSVLNADPDSLKEKFKLTEHTVILFRLINDIRTKPARFVEYRRAKITSVLSAVTYCHRVLGAFPEESVIELMLDGENVVTELTKVSYGSSDTVVLPVETIVKNAEFLGAKRIIVAHNHPSGSSRPSEADLLATQTLEAELNRRGMELLEHVIVAKDECTAVKHRQTIPMSEAESMPWKEPAGTEE
jgi:DNA repair protein RadC